MSPKKKSSAALSYSVKFSDESSSSEISDDGIPEIKQLTYYVQSRNFNGEPRDGKNSACIVELKGNHVLRGLQRLADLGIAQRPLPAYLWKEPIDGKTSFYLKKK